MYIMDKQKKKEYNKKYRDNLKQKLKESIASEPITINDIIVTDNEQFQAKARSKQAKASSKQAKAISKQAKASSIKEKKQVKKAIEESEKSSSEQEDEDEEEDEEEITELDEREINAMIDKRVNFFLTKKDSKMKTIQMKAPQMKTHTPDLVETTSLMSQIKQTAILMAVPYITKVLIQTVGSTFLKVTQASVPHQRSSTNADVELTDILQTSLPLYG